MVEKIADSAILKVNFCYKHSRKIIKHPRPSKIHLSLLTRILSTEYDIWM